MSRKQFAPLTSASHRPIRQTTQNNQISPAGPNFGNEIFQTIRGEENAQGMLSKKKVVQHMIQYQISNYIHCHDLGRGRGVGVSGPILTCW